MAPKSVLITGCSNGGLSSALALAFALYPSATFHIFVTARCLSKMSDLADKPNITLLELRFRDLVVRARGTVVSVTSVGGHCNVPYMGVYNASKRSLEIITDTLRLELAPFGVRVVSLVTGAVDSLGKTHCDGLTLPEDSLYKSIEADIIQRAAWNDGIPRESTAKWAKNVAGRIVGGGVGLTLGRRLGRVDVVV